MEIFKLFGSIFVNNDKANESLAKTDEKGQGVAATLGKGVVAAAKFGVALGAGALAAGGAMFAMAEKASAAVSEINDLSAKLGLSTDSIQELKFAAEQTGTPFEAFETAAAKLTKTMDAARDSNSAAGKAFAQLGISVQDSQGNLKSMDDVLPQVLKKLADMPNATERNALAMQLLGKGAMDLAPLLAQGGVGIEELTTKAHDLGLVLDEEAIAAGDNFGDTLDQVKSALGAVVTQIGINLLPIFQTMLDWIILHMPEIKEVMSVVFSVIETVVTTAYNVFKEYLLPILIDLFKYIEKYWPEIERIGKKVFEEVFKIVKRLWEVFSEQLLPILKKLWEFIEPTFPLIGAIIETAFDTVIGIVNTAISVFEGVLGVINKIIDAFNSIKSAVSNAINAASANVDVSYEASDYTQGLATGTPKVTRGGRFTVGENGPEEVFLPAGSAVLPNGGSPAIVFERGAFEGAFLMDDYGVDKIMNRVVDRARGLGLVTG